VTRRGAVSRKSAKTQHRKPTRPKRSDAPKAARRDSRSPLADLQEQVTFLARELAEAREQQTATAEVLSVISSKPGELEPIFEAMLANGTRLCEAKFGALFLYKEGALHFATTFPRRGPRCGSVFRSVRLRVGTLPRPSGPNSRSSSPTLQRHKVMPNGTGQSSRPLSLVAFGPQLRCPCSRIMS
jgi:hypothetical protein